jgi:hypothetical protein
MSYLHAFNYLIALIRKGYTCQGDMYPIEQSKLGGKKLKQ